MESLQQETPIKLISECFVKPKFQIEAANQPYHLGPIDLFMLSIDPMQKGLLYAFDSTNNNTPSSSSPNNVVIVSHLLDNLKNSLSIALVHFYPLAGRFTTQKHPHENACSIFVDCNKGPGARFIHATALKLTVSDVSACPIDAAIVHPLFDLGERCVNFDGHTKALLSIQVTELLDGVFIGFSMNHSVADGTSFIHFLTMLSEIFTSVDKNENNISRIPVFNYRPWLSSHHQTPVLKFPLLNLEETICKGFDPGPLKERIFNFGPISLAQLKARANHECGSNDVVISSFQSLTAFVWRSLVRSQNLPYDQVTNCYFIIGARNRLDPPISDDYFGGFASQAQWACKAGVLLGHNLGWAAMRLHELITSTNGKMVLDFFKEVADSPTMIPRGSEPERYGENSLIMAGSARFDWCGTDFGLGRAVAVRMGYGGKEDGKISVNAGCVRGSVDLDICLKPHVMAALETDQEFMSFVSIS